MKTTADIIYDIMRREGGYVDHPADKGGPTNKGITLKTLQRYQPGATVADLKALTTDKAFVIYRQFYVEPFHYVTEDRLRALLVDMAVNHGHVNAERMLQRAVGVDDDGHVGPVTLAALVKAGPDAYLKVLAERIKFYGYIITNAPSQAVFAAGWMNRCAEFLT